MRGSIFAAKNLFSCRDGSSLLAKQYHRINRHARRAGIHVASRPSSAIETTTPANTSGSRGVASYTMKANTLLANASQTIAQIEKEIQIPAAMIQAVTITPSSAATVEGGNIQFLAATVSKQAAIWSLLEGPAAGSITPNGLYTAGNLTG